MAGTVQSRTAPAAPKRQVGRRTPGGKLVGETTGPARPAGGLESKRAGRLGTRWGGRAARRRWLGVAADTRRGTWGRSHSLRRLMQRGSRRRPTPLWARARSRFIGSLDRKARSGHIIEHRARRTGAREMPRKPPTWLRRRARRSDPRTRRRLSDARDQVAARSRARGSDNSARRPWRLSS